MRVKLGLLAARLDLTPSDVERLLAGVAGVTVDGDVIRADVELDAGN